MRSAAANIDASRGLRALEVNLDALEALFEDLEGGMRRAGEQPRGLGRRSDPGAGLYNPVPYAAPLETGGPARPSDFATWQERNGPWPPDKPQRAAPMSPAALPPRLKLSKETWKRIDEILGDAMRRKP